MAFRNLISSDRDAVRTITINRPDKLNALNRETINELQIAFDQARYEDTAKGALRESHFELDTVAGAPVPAHVSAPFRFGGGPVKPTRREESKRGGLPPMDLMLPSWNATSTQAGVELAKIDYTQP